MAASPQNLKLIMLRMTKMPMPIQIAAAGQHQLAARIGEHQRHVGGRR